jgi:hypothetical protein
MNGKIKTAIEIAMEKTSMIGELTPEEKEKIENVKKLKPLMAKFYKGKISADGLWKSLKGSKLSLLRETQLNLVESVRLENSHAEFEKRKKGILAIEALKENQNMSIIEQNLNFIVDLQKRAKEEKEQAYTSFKTSIERNPQAMIRTVNQGNGKAVVKLSAEDAIKQSPQWKQFLAENEKRYSQEIAKTIEKLKINIKQI